MQRLNNTYVDNLQHKQSMRNYGFTSHNSSQSSLSFTPSPSSDDNNNNNASATENRLYLARLTLEYQQIVARYQLCLTHLQDAVKDSENLREENSKLRIANKDLTNRLSLLAEVSLRNRLLSPNFPSLSIINDFRNLSVGDNGRVNNPLSHEISDNSNSPTSVIENNRFEKKNGERVTLPKSISVRSTGYLKANPATTVSSTAGGSNSALNRSIRVRSASPVKNNESQQQQQQRVFVPGGNKEEEALEFDVYNQGMFKTELCNKWQETGACPYGEQCQFAHGINELRPVIRHPRYKTEVCRMVLAGDTCPYGHRCHFRHALTEHERRTGTTSTTAI